MRRLAIARAWKRQFGILKTLQYVAYQAVQRFIVLDVTHLMILDSQRLPPAESCDDRCQFRFLDADDVRRFAQDDSNEMDASMADRLASGLDFCYAAVWDGRLASYCWLALDSVESEHNRARQDPRSGVAFSFARDTAFRYKGFTHPDFRGRGLYQQVALRASEALAARQVRFVLSTAEWVNASALRSSYRGGYQYLGLVWLCCCGDLKWVFGPRRLERRDIRFGRRALVTHRKSAPYSPSPNAAWESRLAEDVVAL